MDATLLYRSIMLNVAGSRAVRHAVTTRGWSFAKRFVAGTQEYAEA